MENIDVRLEEGFDHSLARVESNGNRSEDTSDRYSVSGFDSIDKFIVKTKGDSVRSLTIRYRVYRKASVVSEFILPREDSPLEVTYQESLVT